MSERALSPEGQARVERVMWEGPCDVYAEPLRSNITALVRELEEAKLYAASVEIDREQALYGAGLAESRLAALRSLNRENFHATYNGGWHGNADGMRAFHHGMDTVFNALERALAAEGA